MRRSRRTVARALLAAWAVAALSAGSAGAEDHGNGGPVHTIAEEAVLPAVVTTTDPSVTMTCPEQLSCGSGCVAKYVTGYCATVIKIVFTIGLGGFQIGPSFQIECTVCDCWYLAPGPNGLLLRRTYDLGCGASFPGLEHE